MVAAVGDSSGSSTSPESITAMGLVRHALRGEVGHDELVVRLKSWRYDPQYRATGEGDDWELVDNSFDAVEFAYVSGLIGDEDYDAIADAAC